MKTRIKKMIRIKEKDTGQRRFLIVSLHDLYTPPNITFVIKIRRNMGLGTWHKQRRGEERRGEERTRFYGGETEEKRPLVKPKPIWEDNTNMDVRVEWGLGMNDLVQNREKWQNL